MFFFFSGDIIEIFGGGTTMTSLFIAVLDSLGASSVFPSSKTAVEPASCGTESVDVLPSASPCIFSVTRSDN